MPDSLINAAEIEARVDAIAHEISTEHALASDVVLIGVLKGSFIFLADLARRLTIPHRVEFIAVSNYGANESTVATGAVRLLMDLRQDIEGANVVVVEDIVDTGRTLDYLLRNLEARRPATLQAAALLLKPDRLEVQVDIDYVGFEIPNVWVVGYGLDWAERYRTLPYIGVVDPG